MEILLMTGTIKPHINIKYNNVERRLREYEENIERYIQYSLFDRIVFAENSGFDFDYKKFYEMAMQCGKQFEYLDVSATADKDNISTGEAKIILDALFKSELLSQSSAIWKVSGRVWINNINNILKTQKGKNVFLYSNKYDSVQTWLFKAEIDVLKNYLLVEDAIDKMRNSCIEYVWKDIWAEHKNKIAMTGFSAYPDVRGVRSGGGKYTMSRIKFMLKSVLRVIGYYNVKDRKNNELVKRNRL